MTALESLGWDQLWAGQFQQLAPAGHLPGRICVEHRELYHYYGEHGEGVAEVSGRYRHEARGRGDFPAVGDWVVLHRPPGSQLAVIQAVLGRRNKFSRKAAGPETEEQIVAANLDTLFLVTSLNRDLNPRRLERYLAAASAQSFRPVLVLSKSDLCPDAEAATDEIRALLPGVAVHAVSALTGGGLEAVLPYLGPGQTVALVGSSGVGKSTLVNRLLGEAVQPVREIRADDDRGRHTTTRREMIRLPQGGLLIDNPGMRELQLWDDAADLGGTFADVADFAGRCRFADCRHEHEPGCAVKQAVADGLLDPAHLENYFKLRRELAYLETQRDSRAARQRKERERQIHRVYNRFERRRD